MGGDRDVCRHPYAGSPASLSDTPMAVRAAEPVLVLGRSQGSLAVLSPSPLAFGAESGKVWHWQGRDGRLALGTWREVPQPGQDEIAVTGGSPGGADSSGEPFSDSAALGLQPVVDYYLSAEGPKGTLLEALGQR
ncbi:MAG: hypothetical protein OXN89_22205 [Bryobacterales bacterium]|nr:hypothetical protein [Bryobacterales bacterium]